MAASDRSANFVVKAKDAATGPLGKIGGAMGRLKGAAGAAFKAIAAGAVAAAAAGAAFTIGAIKSAADDEKAAIRLNAALKARGQNLDTLGPKIEKQIEALQRFGITDDEVREGLEVGSRFFKGQNTLLKANEVAANIAAATGKDLSTVMLALGRGTQGSTRALAGLGIEVEKGATAQDILTAAQEKYSGVAEEVANSTSGKFTAAQIALNEKVEAFGAKFLPAVNEALTFFTDTILPMVTPALDLLGDIIFNIGNAFAGKGGVADSIGKVVGPLLDDLMPAIGEIAGAVGGLFDAVGRLIGALWGDGEGALANVLKIVGGLFTGLLELMKPVVDLFAWIIDNLAGILEFFTASSKTKPPATPQPGQPGGTYQPGGGTQTLTTNTNLYLDGQVVAQSTNNYLGGYTSNTNGQRTARRGP
jgi:hypothetical protein